MSVITASCVPRPPSVRVFPLPPVSVSDCRHRSVTAGGHCLSLLTVAANMNLKVSDGSSRESEDVTVMIWNVSHVCMSPGQGAGVTLAGRAHPGTWLSHHHQHQPLLTTVTGSE